MYRLLIIFSFCVFLISCSKEQAITIKATNAASNNAYAGLEYYISSSTSKNGVEDFRSETSGYLNANGEAVVKLKMKKGRTYAARVIPPEDNCYSNTDVYYFNEEDESKTFQFQLAECAHLTIHIYNLNCTGETNSLKYRMRYFYSDWGPWSTNHLGCCYGDIVQSGKVPVGNLTIEWQSIRDGQIITDSNTFTLSPGEYRTYQLYY